MRYLIIGDAGSMHIYNFVRTVLLPREYEVHILTLSVHPVREAYREFYRKNGVTIHSVYEERKAELKNSSILSRLRNLCCKVLLMQKVPKADVCHVQSVYKTSMWLVRLFRKKYKTLILSFWGGDIEDRTPSVIALRKKCFSFADCITVTVKQTYDQFQELYGHEFDDVLRISRFATDGLSYVKKISETSSKSECRKHYGIPQDKICISCGYSAYAEQHQDTCLEQIGNLEQTIKNRLHVIVPMQYGNGDEGYINRVKKAAAQCGCTYEILENFVPFEESAMLAAATDIFIHVRDTDAFSNALKEHIYAGSVVIKGEWLVYKELDEMSAPIISVEKREDLCDALTTLLKEWKPATQLVLFEPMYELYSTDRIREQWEGSIEFALRNER